MTFPQTRHSLIHRLSAGGEESDWRQFHADYWGPICRFARRGGELSWEEAEDVAGQTFEVLLRNQLLARWVLKRTAKLRTLLCTVVRHILNNRVRVEKGRARLLREQGGPAAIASIEASREEEDAFYGGWVDDLVRKAVEALLTYYHRAAKGDHIRVLYGRVCEDMSLAEVAETLGLQPGQAENAYKHARLALTRQLENLVRADVERYSPAEDSEAEFAAEWGQLSQYLLTHGALESAVRRAYEGPMSKSDLA